MYLYDARALKEDFEIIGYTPDVQLDFICASVIEDSLVLCFCLSDPCKRLLFVAVPTAPAPETEALSASLSKPSVPLSPLQRAVLDYCAQVEQQRFEGEAYLDAATARVKSIGLLANQLEVQCKCVDVATKNLVEHLGVSEANGQDFLSEFRTQADSQAAVLARFEESLGRLKSVTLHSVLATDHRSTLLDCVPSDKLRDWQARCTTALEALNARTARVSTALSDLRAHVNEEAKIQFDEVCTMHICLLIVHMLYTFLFACAVVQCGRQAGGGGCVSFIGCSHSCCAVITSQCCARKGACN